MARFRHAGATVPVGFRASLALALERRLFDRGCSVTIAEQASGQTLEALEKAGLLVLLVSDRAPDWNLPEDDAIAANLILTRLEESGVLLPEESLTGGEGI
jgi:hypothetical protein